MHHFKFYNKQDILSVTKIRRFETKLGERVQVIANPSTIEASLQASPANYHIRNTRRYRRKSQWRNWRN